MNFKIQPWKHQLDAINSAKNRDYYGLFFEPGCGKTLTLINILRNVYRDNQRIIPTLILSPVAVIENWRREIIANTAPKVSDSIQLLVGVSKKKVQDLLRPDKSIFITNFEALDSKEFCDAVKTRKIKVLVVDESQRICNPGAKRVKKLHEIADRCDYRYILSGTAILNSLLDLWGHLRILSKDQLVPANFYHFRGKYFYNANGDKPWLSWPEWKPRPGAAESLAAILDSCSSSVKKKDCLDLPPLVKKTIYVDMLPAQEKHYKAMEASFITYFLTYLEDKACVTTNAISRLTRLMQLSNGLLPLRPVEDVSSDYEVMLIGTKKLDYLRELLKDLTPNHKVIVWSHWKETYDEIARVCEEENIGFTMLTGGMKASDRNESIDGFTNDPSVRVFIGNQGAGGVGINLQVASYSIVYSRDFSPEKYHQSEARNYRAGSEIHEKITQISLVTKGSVEEVIEESLKQKHKISQLLDSFIQQFKKAA